MARIVWAKWVLVWCERISFLRSVSRCLGAYLWFCRRYPTFCVGVSHSGCAETDRHSDFTANAATCQNRGELVPGCLAKVMRVGMGDGGLCHDLNRMLTGLWLWVQRSGVVRFLSPGTGEQLASCCSRRFMRAGRVGHREVRGGFCLELTWSHPLVFCLGDDR
jgi:hypothetical protein